MTTAEIPLTLVQEAMWARARLVPPDRPFLECGVLRIDGPVDRPSIERAVQLVAAAHPELTMRLVERGKELSLTLGPEQDLLQVIDLSSMPRAERLVAAARVIDELRNTPLDPRTEGTARVGLVTVDSDHHHIVAVVHPLVADRVSLASAVHTLSATYSALLAGQDVPVQRREINAELIVQRRARTETRREDVAAFFAEVLPDELERLSLPRSRAAEEPLPLAGGMGEHTPCLIPPRLVHNARALADELDTSLFIVFLAVLASLVNRYGGHTKVPVLVPFDSRRPGEEAQFGALTSRVPVVVEVDDTMRFVDVVKALDKRYADTLAHTDYPFTLLHDPAQLYNGEMRPLTQVGARYMQIPPLDQQIGPAWIRFEPKRSTRADTDLQLLVFDHGASVTAGFNYSTEVFDASTVARIAGHFRTMLASGLDRPTQTVGELQLLTPTEDRQIRHLWNSTDTPYPADATVHGLIENAAADYPAAPAVVFGNQRLTYAELNEAANRVAHRLMALGATPGSRICVLLDRSFEMPIALLAILKVGAAYVPLEPDLPAARIAFMIADTKAPVLVTVSALAPVDIDDDVAILELDGHAEAIAAESADNPPPAAGPDDIAYVIYTSGSTGAPKAAQLHHTGVVNLVVWIADRYALGSDDRVLLKTPYSHDISVPEFFIPLMLNGRLVIAPPNAHRDPDELVGLITREGVTVIHFVPTMLREFLSTPAVETCTSLRHVFVAGEALTTDLIELFSETLDAQLHSAYGPTETTDYCTIWEAQPDPAPIAPVGRPMANMRLYVVDSKLRLLPARVPGELAIAGVGVGAGYLNRPELTDSRFVDNPFGPGKLYLSGDVGMWRADGVLDFIGRQDGQVKVRGHRVELGEVEAALLRHPALSEAAVLLRQDDPGVRRLIAYVVAAEDGPGASSTELRAWCEQRVPEYAVPSVFIALPAMPRTVSGKLDRKKLPAPGKQRPDVSSEYVAPGSEAERTLAAIWRDVLALDEVGVCDSFVELGGDSILAIRIVGLAQRAGLQISVRSLFDNDTIEAQIAFAAQRAGLSAPVTAPGDPSEPLAPIGWLDSRAFATLRRAHPDMQDAYPLTPIQQGMLFHTLMAPGSGDYVEQAMAVVPATAGLEPGVIAQVWVDVLTRHDALRTSVSVELGEPVAVVHTSVDPVVRELDWTSVDDTAGALAELLDTDRREDFDPLSPPLWRLYVIGEPGGRVRCVFSHHHLLLDGWSLTRLIDDVDSALRAVVAGRAPAPTPVRDVRDYLSWLLRQDDEAALAFWQAELDGVREGTGLGLAIAPAGHPGRGRVVARIDRADIERFCRAERITTATLLHGAVALLLGRYANTTDAVFGTVVSGRANELEDVDTFVGCLLNTIPVRVGMAGSPPAGEWLRALQRRLAAARDHFHVALADIQREVGIAEGRELVRLLMVYEDYHIGDAEQLLEDVENAEAAHVPVIAYFSGDADSLELRLTYNRAMFDSSAMTRLADHLLAVLGGLSADAERALDRVPMLGDDERVAVLDGFNDTAVPLGTSTIPELIAAVPADRVALRADGQEVTYGALNADANRLAHALRALGAGRDVPVAIAMTRSSALVTAKLAVLRAGAAYLPLDLDHPARRLGYVLRDARAPIAIVDAAGRAALAELAPGHDVRIVDVERDADEIASWSADAPHAEIDLDDLAYILYTSGSTGEPKGVLQTHRTVLNMFEWIVREYQLDGADSWLFKTPSTFDVSVPDVFFPLAAGAEVVVAPPDAHKDPDAIIGLITREQVRVVQFVPSMLDAFLDHPGAADCTSLRYVLAAGERLTRPIADRFVRTLPGTALQNLYGPTETFYVTDTRCRGGAEPTIGRPFSNIRAYVLDHRREPVPLGVAGDLWISGAGIARGYIGRDELTAERFRADPFAAGARMYATGDRARWLPDGELEYLGRTDDQVKLHGQRIELGEIEAAIRTHPSVKRAAVSVHEGHGGRQRLIGYLVGEDGVVPDHDEVSAAARDLLPRGLVPSLWMTVDALPTNANGKLDRGALPEPPSRTGGDHVAPRTPTELQLSRLWTEVLGVRSLGIHDDVFAAGANSMSSIKLASRARAHGIEVDVKTVFDHPTIAELARVVEPSGAPVAPAPDAAGAPDWSAETALSWPPHPAGKTGTSGGSTLPARTQRGVLVTGANGFVGAHVVAALLEAGPQDVYALVRAADDDAARARLVAALDDQRLSDRVDLDRVVVLAGDLELREFGLGSQAFARLGQRLDAIVHNGARVHHFLRYSHLRGANVDGTREVLRLAAQSDRTSLAFVSTISCAFALEADGWHLRDDATAPVLSGGYPESKWVAERLVLAAREHMKATAVRLPRVMGDSVTGAGSQTDAGLLLVKGCIQLGACPDWDGWENWAPVDRIARAVAAEALAPGGYAISYITTTPVRFRDMFDAVRAFGWPLQTVSIDEFREQVEAAGEANAAGFALADYGLDIGGDLALSTAPLLAELTPELGGDAPDALDPEWARRILAYLVDVGFLPAP